MAAQRHQPPGEPAIVVDHLTRRFAEVIAVDGVSFAVATGSVFALLGPNGSGKTTMIRMLCGLLPPTSGLGRVLGLDISAEAEAIKERIGYMSQRFGLYDDLTVEENLRFYAGIYSVPRREHDQRVAALCELIGFTGHERQRAGTLSGGWKQRLALACALVHRPPLLFLDEPTAGVDPVSRRRFWSLIFGLARDGVTVFVTTHYLDEAEHADQVAMLYAGRLVALDTPTNLMAYGLHGSLIEVTVDRPLEAIAVLRAIPGVREAVLYRRRLHVISEPGLAPQTLLERLAAAGIRASQLRPITPSLEDVFISLLTGGEEA